MEGRMVNYKPKFAQAYVSDTEQKYYCNFSMCGRAYRCKYFKEQGGTDIHWYGNLLYSDICPVNIKYGKERVK